MDLRKWNLNKVNEIMEETLYGMNKKLEQVRAPDSNRAQKGGWAIPLLAYGTKCYGEYTGFKSSDIPLYLVYEDGLLHLSQGDTFPSDPRDIIMFNFIRPRGIQEVRCRCDSHGSVGITIKPYPQSMDTVCLSMLDGPKVQKVLEFLLAVKNKEVPGKVPE
ncbi:MAG: hypothetical protein Q9221_003343 [Calogaya cf. arnoldii]